MITLNLTPEQEATVRSSLGVTQVDYKVSKINCIKALRTVLRDCGLYEAKTLLDLFVLMEESKCAPTYLEDKSSTVVDTIKIQQVMDYARLVLKPTTTPAPKEYWNRLEFRNKNCPGEPWMPSKTYSGLYAPKQAAELAAAVGRGGSDLEYRAVPA